MFVKYFERHVRPVCRGNRHRKRSDSDAWEFGKPATSEGVELSDIQPAKPLSSRCHVLVSLPKWSRARFAMYYTHVNLHHCLITLLEICSDASHKLDFLLAGHHSHQHHFIPAKVISSWTVYTQSHLGMLVNDTKVSAPSGHDTQFTV